MRSIQSALGVAVLLGVAVAGRSPDVSAGDHAEAPALENDLAADIADLYAWHTDGGNLVIALTWAGYGLVGDPATYDADVLYTIHIDTNADNTADTEIHARFGQAADGSWGVQVQGIPGADGAVEGAVETELTAGDAKVWAGLRDDPFFFDKEGYIETLTTGTVAFDSTRDFALNQNATALVMEFPLSALGASGSFAVWSSTGRK